MRYGIRPKNARPGLIPGCCKGKAHRREYLGYGGAGDGNRTRTISLRIKRGPSAECSLVVFLHVTASHVSNGCARIQPGPTSL
jgi:hypothetical protein